MSADSSLPTAAHAPAAGTEQPQELPRAFSYEAVPARVFEYRAGVVSLLHETSPITVVFDGSALRLYAQGQVCNCVQKRQHSQEKFLAVCPVC